MRATFVSDRHHQTAALRRALTLFEVTLATVLLAILLPTSLRMIHVVKVHHAAGKQRELAAQLAQAITEQVANIPWRELSQEALARISLPPDAAARLPSVALSIEMGDEMSPTAKRVRIKITWKSEAGTTSAVALTSWVYPERSS